jgi:hypothetical protein
MKFKRQTERGNVLMTTLVTAALIGITLVAYLNMTSSQNMSVVRSQSWNSCVAIVEAGIEEALTQLYHTGTTNLGANGWQRVDGLTLPGATLEGTLYTRQRTLGDSYYTVVISTNTPPVIHCAGYVRAPLSTNYLARTVRVTTKRDGLFSKGLVAKGQIDMNGNKVAVDSFDSADPSYSTSGQYDPNKRKDNGDVATNLGIVNALDQFNADIWGHVSTGPGGTIGIGPNGSAGDLAWHAAGKDGIQSGWSSADMNVSFPDVEQPFLTAVAPPPVIVPPYNAYQYVIPVSGNWQIGSLTGGLCVRSNANAVLLVTGDISITGQDSILIEPGASLQLYMKGASATIGGNGVVNQGGNATNFFYWGMTNNTELKIAGNGSFKGVIYAPQAAFEMRGGGNSSTEDVVGASVTGTATLTGNFNFHYDESLGRLGPNRAFIVSSWNEI